MKRMLWFAALLAGCAGSPEEPFSYRVPPRSREAAPAARPDREPVDLTLENALSLMEAHHPDLAAARAAAEAARGNEEQAGRLPNPELIGRVEAAPVEGGTADDADYLAGVAQRVPVGGRLGAASEAATLEREAREREIEARRQDLRMEVRSAFAALLYMERAVDAREEALDLARRGAATARARVQVGDAVAGEAAEAELEVLKEEIELERAGLLRDHAARSVAKAVGVPDLRIASADGDLEQALEVPTLESLLARLDGDAWVAAARSRLEASRERVSLAEAERIPDIQIELFYRRIGATDTDAFDAGFGIALPLFDANSGNVRTARAEVEQAAAASAAVRNEREIRVRSAHARLAAAVKRSRRMREEIVPRSRSVLQVVEARYAAGDVSLPDVLPLRRRHVEVKTAYLESLRESMEAWARLRPFLQKTD